MVATTAPLRRLPPSTLVAGALLFPPLLYWIAITLYVAGSQSLSEVVLDRAPDVWEVAFMLGAPLLAALIGAWSWLRATTVRARVIGQFAVVAGLLFAAIGILASLRPS
jgi:hypothetical protein